MAQGCSPSAWEAPPAIDHFHRQTKTYRCTVRAGERSETLDTEGTVTPGADAGGLDAEQVRAALRQFVGEISQILRCTPPCATRASNLYDWPGAEQVERQPRTALIVSAELTDFRPGCVAEATSRSSAARGPSCGPGQRPSATRSGSGPAQLAGAHPIRLSGDRRRPHHRRAEELEDPTTALLPPWVAVSFSPGLLDRRRSPWSATGRPSSCPGWPPAFPRGRPAHSPSGDLVAVGEVTGFRFRPTKVMAG